MTEQRVQMQAWLRRADPQSPVYREPTGTSVADVASVALRTIDDQPLR